MLHPHPSAWPSPHLVEMGILLEMLEVDLLLMMRAGTGAQGPQILNVVTGSNPRNSSLVIIYSRSRENKVTN